MNPRCLALRARNKPRKYLYLSSLIGLSSTFCEQQHRIITYKPTLEQVSKCSFLKTERCLWPLFSTNVKKLEESIGSPIVLNYDIPKSFFSML